MRTTSQNAPKDKGQGYSPLHRATWKHRETPLPGRICQQSTGDTGINRQKNRPEPIHSRYALAITAHRRVTGSIVVSTFRKAVTAHGIPASVLSDNGLVYTTRFAGGKGGRNGFEHELSRLGIKQKNSRPNHPTTCGKVERFQQTMKKWLRKQDPQPATISEPLLLLHQFIDEYNNTRPHRSLGRRTPLAAWLSRPKATPAGSAAGTHYRIRHDIIDGSGTVSLRHAGKMFHIDIGRTLAATRIILLIDDLHIGVVHANTTCRARSGTSRRSRPTSQHS